MQVHAETGKGQYEVVLGYTEASTAIISLIYEREVIKSVARQHGMMATFVPKYVAVVPTTLEELNACCYLF